MNKEQLIKDFINYLNDDIQSKDFLTYREQDEWKDYLKRIIDSQAKEKDKEIERLNNIIKPKEVNYNYLKLLFEKKDKEEVIKSYVYKCEQLEKLYKSYEEKEIEVMKKDNIINELEAMFDGDLDGFFTINEKGSCNEIIEVIQNYKNKLKELKEGK